CVWPCRLPLAWSEKLLSIVGQCGFKIFHRCTITGIVTFCIFQEGIEVARMVNSHIPNEDFGQTVAKPRCSAPTSKRFAGPEPCETEATPEAIVLLDCVPIKPAPRISVDNGLHCLRHAFVQPSRQRKVR